VARSNWRFGQYEVDPGSRRLLCGGEEIHVQPQVFDVLCYLLEHRSRVIPKEELLDEVWGSRFVSESALTSRVKSARQAIGDDGRRQETIATVHGRGYRFVGEIETIPVGRDAPVETSLRALAAAPEELAERDGSLAALRRAFERTAAGTGQVVLLRGEAGIGKTALLQSFFDELPVDGSAAPALASCVRLRTPSTLTPIFDLLEQLGRTEAETDPIDTPAAAVAALAGWARPDAPPTVLGIDDLQWADDATLDVVALLARRLTEVPLLLVLTLRSDAVDAGHPVHAVLADLRSRGADVEDLEPLSRDAVRRLAGVADAEADDLHVRTGGNPLLVSQVIGSTDGAVPGGVNDIVLARLAEMTPAGRRATEAMAISPVPLELPVAAAYLGADLPSLAEADKRNLLMTSDSAVGFRHDLVRRAIHDSILVFDRLPLHRRLLDALPSSVPVARRLHHAVEGVVVDAVLELGPEAARDAARLGSHREAVELYEKILGYPTEFDDETTAALTSEHAYQLYLVWDLRGAIDVATRAAQLWADRGEPFRQGAVLTTLARAQVWTDSDRARATGAEAIELLAPAGTSTEAARAYCEMAGLHVFDDKRDVARELAEIGLRMAEELSDRGLQALALNYLGCVEHSGSDGWEAMLRRSIDLAVGAGQVEYATRAIANLSVGLWDSGRWRESSDVLAEAEPLIAGVEYQGSIITVRLQAAHVAASFGDDEAALAIIEWIRATDRTASLGFECDVLEHRIRMRRGEQSGPAGLRQIWASVDAAAWSERSVKLATGHQVRSAYSTLLFFATLAELAWRTGDIELAQDVNGAAVRERIDFPLRTELGELSLYLHLAGVDQEADADLLEPYAIAIGGDLEAAAASFERMGRPVDAAACLQASALVERD